MANLSKKMILLTAVFIGVILQGVTRAQRDDEDLGKGLEDQGKAQRLFAFYSTISVTSLTTTTITGLSTCLSSASAGSANCQGRKRRALKPISLAEPDVEELSSSLEEDPAVVEEDSIERRDVSRSRTGGRSLTIWSTNFTTLTVTFTSILPSVTITATALCNFPNQAQACFGS